MDILKKEVYESPEIMVVKVESEGIMTNSEKRDSYGSPYEL